MALIMESPSPSPSVCEFLWPCKKERKRSLGVGTYPKSWGFRKLKWELHDSKSYFAIWVMQEMTQMLYLSGMGAIIRFFF